MTSPMSPPQGRKKSNRLLALFLAAAVVPPVVLVLGPFRDRFFPGDARAVQGIAVSVRPRWELADWERIVGAQPSATALASQLADEWEAGRYGEVAAQLERLPAVQASAELRYAYGIARLLDHHPALALESLQGAVSMASGVLANDARFALAQAHLGLGRADDARRTLQSLSGSLSDDAWRIAVREQLDQLAPHGRRAERR